MHQFSHIRIIPIHSVYIQDMRTISERFSGCQIHPLDLVYRITLFTDVIFRDEDDIGIRQFVKIFSGMKVVDIDYAGMISGPVRVCSGVTPLDLNVVFLPLGVRCIYIKIYGTPLQMPDQYLRSGCLHLQIRFVHQNPQDKFGTRDVFIEKSGHIRVIEQTEAPQFLYVLLSDLLRCLLFSDRAQHTTCFLLFLLYHKKPFSAIRLFVSSLSCVYYYIILYFILQLYVIKS